MLSVSVGVQLVCDFVPNPYLNLHTSYTPTERLFYLFSNTSSITRLSVLATLALPRPLMLLLLLLSPLLSLPLVTLHVRTQARSVCSFQLIKPSPALMGGERGL